LNKKHTLRLLVALTLAAAGTTALASRVVGDVVSGPVTAVSHEALTVNGHQYHIKAGSPAASAVAHLTAGQNIEVHLDGPVAASRSEVINVIVRQGR
jgi:hypothetical protein